MIHGFPFPFRARRRLPLLAGALGLPFLLLGAAPSAAVAQQKPTGSQTAVQGETQGADTPVGETFDVRLELHAYFNQRLPAGWWIAEPEHRDGRSWLISVHIPKRWRGSPETAMLTLCPDRKERLWQQVEVLSLAPFYHDLPWAGHDCKL